MNLAKITDEHAQGRTRLSRTCCYLLLAVVVLVLCRFPWLKSCAFPLLQLVQLITAHRTFIKGFQTLSVTEKGISEAA